MPNGIGTAMPESSCQALAFVPFAHPATARTGSGTTTCAEDGEEGAHGLNAACKNTKKLPACEAQEHTTECEH